MFMTGTRAFSDIVHFSYQVGKGERSFCTGDSLKCRLSPGKLPLSPGRFKLVVPQALGKPTLLIGVKEDKGKQRGRKKAKKWKCAVLFGIGELELDRYSEGEQGA